MRRILRQNVVPLGPADDDFQNVQDDEYPPSTDDEGGDPQDMENQEHIEQEDDYVSNNPIESLDGWDEPISDDPNARTLADVAYSLIDWQTRFKANNVATSGVWDFGSGVLPDDHNMGKFGRLENVLKLHRAQTVQVIHACPNMCVAFWNPTHRSLTHRLDLMNAHRTRCPKCGQARYEHGTKKPVRIFWYMPIKYWMQDLFCKGDMVPFMANDLDPTKYADGHVRRYVYNIHVYTCTIGHIVTIYPPNLHFILYHCGFRSFRGFFARYCPQYPRNHATYSHRCGFRSFRGFFASYCPQYPRNHATYSHLHPLAATKAHHNHITGPKDGDKRSPTTPTSTRTPDTKHSQQAPTEFPSTRTNTLRAEHPSLSQPRTFRWVRIAKISTSTCSRLHPPKKSGTIHTARRSLSSGIRRQSSLSSSCSRTRCSTVKKKGSRCVIFPSHPQARTISFSSR
jgi:hypothetical protein